MNPGSMLFHELEHLKVRVELDAEAVGIDEELLQVLEAWKEKKQKPR